MQQGSEASLLTSRVESLLLLALLRPISVFAHCPRLTENQWRYAHHKKIPWSRMSRTKERVGWIEEDRASNPAILRRTVRKRQLMLHSVIGPHYRGMSKL